MVVKKKLVLGAATACILFATCGTALRAAEETTIPAPRLALIKELLVASRTTRNARMGFDMVFSQELRGISAAIGDRIDQNPMLTAAQKTEAKHNMQVGLDRRTKRFNQLMDEQLNLEKTIEEVFVPMFDKHFTEPELKEMLAYYKSLVGQKSLDLLPQMSMEASMVLNGSLRPKLKQLSQQVEDEERASAAEALQKLQPAQKVPGEPKPEPDKKP